MTSTSVVLGIATLGTAESTLDCDCAMDATGSIAMRKGSMSFMELSFQFVLVIVAAWGKEYACTLWGQKIYTSTKDLIKKLLASINSCSRFWADEVMRTTVSTPAMLE